MATIVILKKKAVPCRERTRTGSGGGHAGDPGGASDNQVKTADSTICRKSGGHTKSIILSGLCA